MANHLTKLSLLYFNKHQQLVVKELLAQLTALLKTIEQQKRTIEEIEREEKRLEMQLKQNQANSKLLHEGQEDM